MADTEKKTTTSDQTVLLVTYVNIVLYALCFQLQRPVEPFLIQWLSEKDDSGGADAVNQTYGHLQSFFQLVQMFGAPVVGILLDRIGIRYTSAVVFLSSALSYGILAMAFDLKTLFLSKLPTMLQAAFLVAQATAATSTGNDSGARAAALGRMTTAYTIGATLGPAMGGYLADQGDFYIGAKLAVFGSLVSVALSLIFLPNKVAPTASPKTEEEQLLKSETRSFWDDLRRSGEIATRSALWPLLMVKVVGGVVASMHSTALPLILTQQLKFEPSQLGMSMSGSMFAVAVFGAVGMAPMIQWLGSYGMIYSGLTGRMLCGLAIAAIITLATTTMENTESVLIQVVSASILHSLSAHALATGLTTQTTGAVDKDEQGSLLGLEHSLFSLARIGGPTLSTTLLEIGTKVAGLWTVEVACGSTDMLMMLALMLLTSRVMKPKDS